MKIRPNDIVRHLPSGEEWTVCGVNKQSGYLIPCGYPFPSMGKIEDCELLESRGLPQTEEYKEALKRKGCNSFIEDEP